ncbi:MAG: DinB family protein [Gemmatimonadales bacterium]
MKQQSITDALFEQMDRTQGGEPWYGPARELALKGITFTEAAKHPIKGAPSIWELVLHMRSWTREVARRLSGAAPGVPADGDWPPIKIVNARAWTKAKAELAAAHAELIAAARGLSPAWLARIVGELHSPPLGTGTTVAGMLVGLAQHDAYHVGQLFLLRRALKAKSKK